MCSGRTKFRSQGGAKVKGKDILKISTRYLADIQNATVALARNGAWLRTDRRGPGFSEKALRSSLIDWVWSALKQIRAAAITMAKKAISGRAANGKTRKAADRVSTREDGRLSTLFYLDPILLAEVQAAAKERHQPTWLFVEEVLEKAMKSRKAR